MNYLEYWKSKKSIEKKKEILLAISKIFPNSRVLTPEEVESLCFTDDIRASLPVSGKETGSEDKQVRSTIEPKKTGDLFVDCNWGGERLSAPPQR